ncbi:MAG: ATP-binding cassette domain-containing protein, partial [Oscillospiraceae bacterium]|nr:ATP-binding cassette domain-containing protein [Oscillospiraceae bacterium]
DAYRNHSVGFVFQSYNLIPHQTVLSNVELALTLSGVSKKERTDRAKAVLQEVGLADQIYKKPNQLSGGQMQRVAIARALVNNPDILLADEPTGALDSETSVQIMEILKEISKEKLVIMVTHNPELADQYSTRIVRLLDGLIISDSDPVDQADSVSGNKDSGKVSMSFFMALSLSLNNLMTKKARTFLTAFAGSIGIIGIALILALSNGMTTYIARVEEETLSSYPLVVQREVFDFVSFMQTMDGDGSPSDRPPRADDRIYVNNIMNRMMNMTLTNVHTNNLVSFKAQLEADSEILDPLVTAITFSYDLDLHLYREDESGGFFRVNPNPLLDVIGMGTGPMDTGPFSMPMMGNNDIWVELIDNPVFLESQYDLLAGRWPESAHDVVLIVSGGSRISDIVMYSLGLYGPSDLRDMQQAWMAGQQLEYQRGLSFSFDEILELNYRLVLPPDRFVRTDSGWADLSDNFIHMQDVFDHAIEINIVGILRPNEDAVAAAQSGVVGFTSALTRYVIDRTNSAEIVAEQRQSPNINVFTGMAFDDAEQAAAFASIDDVYAFIATLPDDTREQSMANVSGMREAGASDEQIVAMFNESAAQNDAIATFEENLRILGAVDIYNPSAINIFPSSFENKEAIIDYINAYNARVSDEYMISYTDLVGLLMSSITTVINAISYMLIAFVSISFVVSSIMIGIITYISVLERTKEIGILRSIGASKRDISRVFNAETLIIGFVAGALGIAVTLLLTIPANAIIYRVADINNVALLPVVGALVLVAISMLLSFIAGLLPSRMAAKKDPVVALRTE